MLLVLAGLLDSDTVADNPDEATLHATSTVGATTAIVLEPVEPFDYSLRRFEPTTVLCR